jgi:hypothetical protein
MKPLPLVALSAVVVCSACNYRPLPSNDPDSGVTCLASVSPAGSGTVQGANAFAVGSSYQRAGEYRDADSGVQNGVQLDVSLYKRAVSCTALQDGGATGEAFHVTLIDHASTRITPGTYPVSGKADGGAASFIGLGLFDGGLHVANEGTFTLAAVQSCSVSGSFDVRFPIPDGGSEPFSGTFNSEFCAN